MTNHPCRCLQEKVERRNAKSRWSGNLYPLKQTRWLRKWDHETLCLKILSSNVSLYFDKVRGRKEREGEEGTNSRPRPSLPTNTTPEWWLWSA